MTKTAAQRILRLVALIALWLFAPSSVEAACSNPEGMESNLIYNTSAKVFQYCDGTDWIAMHPTVDSIGSDPCETGPLGTVCDSDGAVYAGTTVGGARMYVATADEGGTYWWKTTSTSTSGTDSTTDGLANTNAMISAGAASHPAGNACRSRGADWYLPAIDELATFYDNATDLGAANLPTGSSWYWSSSEVGTNGARVQQFSDGTQSTFDKTNSFPVRCVRRGPVPAGACSNPEKPEGTLTYNTVFRVMQGCAGGVWKALGPVDCPNIGDLCADGTIHAGISPDGNAHMYTTPADSPQDKEWGSYGSSRGATDYADGDGNTEILAAFGETAHPAAYYCDQLTAHLHSDWYLPARSEFDVLFGNMEQIGGFDTTSYPYYWTSTEGDANSAFSKDVNGGGYIAASKANWRHVRCVRKRTVDNVSGECADAFGLEGALVYNSSSRVMQYCNGANWIAIGKAAAPPLDLCAGSPSPGDVCDDGSIYAGLSPDGNVPMYTTPADAPSTYTWNDGTGNYTDMSMANCTDSSPGTAASCQTGEANTAFLVGATGEPDYPFAAAEYCDGLSAHGYSDWYLPAQDELNVLYTNKNTGALNGTFNETGSYPAGYYWSSSEYGNVSARFQRFSDGAQHFNYVKDDGLAVRCVRR